MTWVALWALVWATGGMAADPIPEQLERPWGFELIRANLAGVQRELGPSQIRQVGSDGGAEWHLCYYLSREGAVVIFKTSALGGAVQDLLGVEMARVSTQPQECGAFAAASARLAPLAIGSLHLGMSERAYRKALGSAEVLHEGGLGRVFQRRLAMSADEAASRRVRPAEAHWDVQTGVSAKIHRGAVTRLEVWKTETH